MEKKIKKCLKWGKKHQSDVMIGFVSILAFIVGGFALGWLKSFLVVSCVDLVLVFTLLYQKRKRNLALKNKSVSKGKTNVQKAKSTPNKEKVHKHSKLKMAFKICLIMGFTCCIIVLVAGCMFLYDIVKKAPKFDPNRLDRKEATIVYNVKGGIMAKLGEQKREKVTFDELPEVFINALIATEDSRFFQHNGFDLPRFLKASFSQVLHGDGGGASTLTMQVSKNNYTSTVAVGAEGIKRKFTDIYMSIFQIEKKYTKQEIIEFYVNDPYLGAGAYGVEQAAQTYFGKSIRDVNLAEAAMIAGLFQSPVAYDPYINPELTESRRQTVLYLMERHGYITSAERKIAEALPVEKILSKATSSSQKYQSFLNIVMKEVMSDTKLDPYTTPMEIYTTMDPDKQDHINDIVSGKTFDWENEVVNAGISVVNSKTGAIVAIGGGRGPQVEKGGSLAVGIQRQIGSTAKPLYDFGPGIEYNNWSTYTPFVDEEYTYSNGTDMSNWDGEYMGFMTLRKALAESRNVTALKAFKQVSNKKIQQFVTGLGLSPELEDGIIHEAHAIGGYNGESPTTLAAAYAAFGNGGYYVQPHSYTKIVYRETGEVHEKKVKKSRAMSEQTAYMITNVLQDTAVSALGTYSYVNGVRFAAKTGTTNFDDNTFKVHNLPWGAINDLWVAGYDSNYAIAVWYGYDKGIDKNYISKFGNKQHAKLFQSVAKNIFKEANFKRPSDVLEIEVEKESYPAKLPSKYTPDSMKTKELFKKGSEPTEVSKRYDQLTNVTELNSSVNGGKVTLTWKAVSTPEAIDKDKLTSFFKSLYKKEEDQKKYLEARIAYNNKYIGNLGYQVYIKNADNSLTSLGYTTETTFTYEMQSASNVTFVVKTAYSIFKSNMSSGAEHTIQNSGASSIITGGLNGDMNITLAVGDVYTEPNPSVIVLEDMVDVSNQATVTTSIVRASDKQVVNAITTDKEDTFTITYTIVYKHYTDTVTRTIEVKGTR